MADPQGTFILTGAAGGIGRAVAEQFSNSPCAYTGLLTVRCADNPNVQPLRRILLQSDKQHSVVSLELSSLESVRQFASDVNQRVSSGSLPPIRALVLNAGYMSKHGQQFTQDGYEMNFQVNYLSNFLLVLLLLPSMDRVLGRIIFITSWTHDPSDSQSRLLPLRKTMWRPVADLAQPSVPDTRYNKNQAGVRRYAESKLWLMMFMHALQARLETAPELFNVSTLSIDPGCVLSTGIMREQAWITRGPFRVLLNNLTPCMQRFRPNGTFRTADRSARDILKACFSTEDPVLGKRPRALYLDGSEVKISSKESRDVEKQRLLWEGSLKLVNLVT